MEDAQLVAGALAGKAECFDALYLRYRGMVRSVIIGMGVPESDADDLTQDVLADVGRKLGNYDQSRARFSTWVSGFVKKAVARYWRDKARQPDLDSLDAGAEDSVASEDVGPAAMHDRKLLHQEITDLICRLKPKLREPVMLYWFQELSVAEIARALGRPYSTVQGQLKEGMRDLRALIAGEPALAAAR